VGHAAADRETQDVVHAATAFLTSLSAGQRQKLLFPFTPQKAAVAANFKKDRRGRRSWGWTAQGRRAR
jgi:hypothetical protein